VPLWRRKPLHERLAREGGLVPPEPRLPWREVGIHGIHRLREWDAVATADAGPLRVEEVEFAALADGTLVVESDVPDERLQVFADAVEASVKPPYRARAVYRGDSRWAVAANAIEVVELPTATEGDELELAVHGQERTLRIDGEHAFGSLPDLERLARDAGEHVVVRARRLDGALWEVDVSEL
jgi:hypothetical protein